jgi:hypothetical protein
LLHNWLGLSVVLLIWLAVLAALTWPFDGYALGLAQGVFATALVPMILTSFLMVSGSAFQLSGAWGEDNTRDVLKSAKRKRHIHGWIDNLEVQGGDVDHLVITRAGAFALDSKWHSHGITPQVIAQDVERARASARRASNILRSISRPQPVTPVVILWGGDREWARGGRAEDGVRFVCGPELKSWLSVTTQVVSIDDRQAREILGELAAFKERVRPADTSFDRKGQTRWNQGFTSH